MKKIYSVFIFLAILSIGAFLRLYKLEEIPNGLYIDEAAQGYNAYSFLLTGKDEYGKVFPIFLRTFSAYSSPLYTYLTIIPVYFLGLSVFSVRIVSAISGILLIIITFLIFKEISLFRDKFTPLIGTFFIAISPWGIFFSRGAFEANLGMILLCFSIYLYLLSKKYNAFVFLSIIFLALSTYAYQAERAIAYLLIIGMIIINWRNNRKLSINPTIVISLILFVLLEIPQLILLNTPAFTHRATGLFYFKAIENQTTNSLLPNIFSLPFSFFREFLSQFMTYLSPRNLFFEPDPDPQRSIPQLSVYYFWMSLPYIIGFYYLVKNYKMQSSQYVLLLLCVFTVIPALTLDPFSTLRSLPLLLPITLIISLGMEQIASITKKHLFFSVLITLVSLSMFWRSYFVLFPNERAKDWGYGFKQLAYEINTRPSEHFIIDQTRIKPAYVMLAFYLKFPPEKLQAIVKQEIKDNYYTDTEFDPLYKIENFETRNIVWSEDIYKDQIIIGDEFSVSSSQAKEHYLNQVFQIKDPLGQIIFTAFKTNPKEKCKQSHDITYCP